MQSEGKGTLELTSVAEMVPAKLAAFGEEMDRYFRTHQAYLVLYRKAETDGGQAEALLKQAHALLADARARVTLPEPITALEDQLKNHNKFAKYQVDGREAVRRDHRPPGRPTGR